MYFHEKIYKSVVNIHPQRNIETAQLMMKSLREIRPK